MADINITAINPVSRRVTFAFQIVPRKTRGIETLLQLSAKTILTTPGLDLFAPEYGGGILAYAGKNLNVNDLPRIKADIAYIVRKSETQILEEQITLDIPSRDRLRALTLLSIDYIPDEGALEVRVLVTADNGEAADISLANQIRLKRGEGILDPTESLRKLHESLNGVYKTIMEMLYGYNGQQMLTVPEISVKLSAPESFIIEVRNSLSVRLKEIQS